MFTICVMVAGLVGEWCYPNAELIGDCRRIDPVTYQCTISDITTLPYYASWYDPRREGTNCFYDPETGEDTCDYLGDGTLTETAYGWAMACPLGLYDSKFTFENIPGEWWCRDHGTAIHVTYGRRYTSEGFKELWYIPFDFLLKNDHPYWVYGVGTILTHTKGNTYEQPHKIIHRTKKQI